MDKWISRFVSRVDNGEVSFYTSGKGPAGQRPVLRLEGARVVGEVISHDQGFQRSEERIIADAIMIAGHDRFYLSLPSNGRIGTYTVIVVD